MFISFRTPTFHNKYIYFKRYLPQILNLKHLLLVCIETKNITFNHDWLHLCHLTTAIPCHHRAPLTPPSLFLFTPPLGEWRPETRGRGWKLCNQKTWLQTLQTPLLRPHFSPQQNLSIHYRVTDCPASHPWRRASTDDHPSRASRALPPWRRAHVRGTCVVFIEFSNLLGGNVETAIRHNCRDSGL